MLNFARCFHVSVVTRTSLSSSLYKSESFKLTGMMARVMKKHFIRNPSKRGEFGLLPLGIVPKVNASVRPKGLNYRRANSLNKVFMQYVTDFMTTRFLCEKTGDLLAEVNRVETSPDFQVLNVFYVNRNDVDSKELQKKLNGIGGELRHEMSQLKVTGHVPKINFILDQRYLKMVEVEKLLKTADFGDSEEIDERPAPVGNADIPVSHSIYGLNHREIAERIKHRKRLAKKPTEVKIETKDLNCQFPSNDLTSSSAEMKLFLRRRGGNS